MNSSRFSPHSLFLALLACLLLVTGALHAQQVVVGTPMQNASDSFVENIGVGFAGQFPGGSFRGPPLAPTPGLPGVNPAGGGNLGFRINGGGFGLGLNFGAVQGSSRGMSSITPSVTVPNGGTGSIFSGSQTPFVTGLVPFVGGYGFNVPTPYYPVAQPQMTSPLQDKIRQYYAGGSSASRAPVMPAPVKLSPADEINLKLTASPDSTASSGDLSVAEIKRRRQARLGEEAEGTRREIAALLQRARGAEEAGKIGVARIYLRQAISRAEGDLRRELTNKLKTLDSR